MVTVTFGNAKRFYLLQSYHIINVSRKIPKRLSVNCICSLFNCT